MRDTAKQISGAPRAALAKAALAATALCLALLAAAPAQAAFEQTGTFAGSPAPVSEEKFAEEVQLGGVGGLAVNYTGAGGVPKGTVYAATKYSGITQVAMFYPKGGGGLEFEERWAVRTVEGPYERCGPLLGTEEVEGRQVAEHPCDPSVQENRGSIDVDVNQATGNAYVLNDSINVGMKNVIVYSSQGAEVIARFAEQAPGGKTTAETPELLHRSSFNEGIEVDEAGVVYVYDQNSAQGYYERLMVFKPKTPGLYGEYEYAGEVLPKAGTSHPTRPALDEAGNLYVVSGVGLEKKIEEFAPQVPSPYPATAATPLCSYEFAKGGIRALGVDPESGEVFFSSYKTLGKLYRLGACNESTGKFAESEPEPEAIAVGSKYEDLSAFAFDPERRVSPSRPAGTLYGGIPAKGEGSPAGLGPLGYVFARSEGAGPEVEAESVAHVTEARAILSATVNPRGFATRYAFQYETVAAYEANPPSERFVGAAEVPLGGGELSGAPGGKPVIASLSGLAADTTYRYRAVAISHCIESEPETSCEGTGEAMVFRTYPGLTSGLPDSRAWELVSPAEKHGGQAYPADPRISSCGEESECKPGTNGARFPMQGAPDGQAVAYEGSSFGQAGAPVANAYISHRTPAGWQTTDPTPPLLGGRNRGYMAYSPDLAQAVIEQVGPALSAAAPADYANLYAQALSKPLALTPLLRTPTTNRGAGELRLSYAGASVNLSRVFFMANDALTEGTAYAPPAPPVGSQEFDLYEWRPASGQIVLVGVLPNNSTAEPGSFVGPGSAHGISADGARIFFEGEAGHLFVRIDGTHTREIHHSGSFLSANADGTKVLLSDGCLYDVEAEECVDLTAGNGGFEGLVGQSEDLSHVYFVDTAVLDETPNEAGEEATEGEHNLYAWGAATRFVATLAGNDNSSSPAHDWVPAASERTAEASPGGRYLTFVSHAPLTGYDNTGPCESSHGLGYLPGPCREVFLYDSQTGRLSCSSCNPSGALPVGPSGLRLLDSPGTVPQSRYLLDSGRLYFDSQDSLLPVDTNEGVEDVYEYEPLNSGSCNRPEGCVFLVSSGHGGADSNFLATDETGKNVFFTTRERLLKQDSDELIDLYDAREGGGFPEPPTAPAECQGEACQPSSNPPSELTPASAAFHGAGNLHESAKPRGCPTGKRRVRRHGRTRCVRKAHRSHHRHHKRRRHPRANRRAGQ